MDRIVFKGFADVLEALEELEAKQYELLGKWHAHQHLVHCAQAIAFSIDGYPQIKPRIMRGTIGKLAFHYFSTRGYMSHDTNMLTPGANHLAVDRTSEAIIMLRKNINRLKTWEGPLQPHEFYGKLSKGKYIQAHCMHFANHFENFKFGK